MAQSSVFRQLGTAFSIAGSATGIRPKRGPTEKTKVNVHENYFRTHVENLCPSKYPLLFGIFSHKSSQRPQ